MTEQEQKAFNQMLEAVEKLKDRLVTKCADQLVRFNYVDVDLLNLASEAIASAKAARQK